MRTVVQKQFFYETGKVPVAVLEYKIDVPFTPFPGLILIHSDEYGIETTIAYVGFVVEENYFLCSAKTSHEDVQDWIERHLAIGWRKM